MSRPWTEAEVSFLADSWGVKSIPTIAKRLNRSIYAVKNKASRLKLGAFLESGEYITLNQLYAALGCSGSGTAYRKISWEKNRQLPVKTKKVLNCSFKVIKIDDFWKWAEKNRHIINFSKMEENILGAEPQWVKEQRSMNCNDYKTDPWTDYEDSKLKYMLREFKYTYIELSRMLNRSCGAIQRRIVDLGLRERPVKANNHIKWQQTEVDMLNEYIKKGLDYKTMSIKLCKSDKAIRGKVYSIYKTESLDKVRKSGVIT